MANIIVKNVEDLTKTEYRACYLANYGFSGYMREELTCSKRSPVARPAKVIMIWDGPADSIVSLKGWSLLTPVRTWGLVAATRYTKTKAKYTVQFWVKQQHRKQGYGKLLMAEVKKLDDRPHVFPHDNASAELFSSFKVTVTKDDKCWLRKKPQVA